MAGTPAGFNANAVRAGLHTAMQFGAPEDAQQQATFFTLQPDVTTAPVDGDNVPFNPAASITKTPPKQVKVDCAVEYVEGALKLDAYGYTSPDTIRLTLLDVDYTQVKGFDYVVIGGVRFDYRKTLAPVGLGPITVWVVQCESVDVS